MEENTSQDTQQAGEQEKYEKAQARLEPILAHLKVENVEIDKSRIRENFAKLWEFENGEELSPETQFLTTVALFMYTSQNVLDDHNIRIDQARQAVIQALRDWRKPELEKMVAEERAAENPFKAFVEKNQPKVDETYTWENFLLEHKRADEKEWTYKMKKCFFHQFFIRFGRPDYIMTACLYDQIPWEERKDYVDLKLNNMFAKLGTVCQFSYKPVKKDS